MYDDPQCIPALPVFLEHRHTPITTLFPYTTLFRSVRPPKRARRLSGWDAPGGDHRRTLARAGPPRERDRKSTRLNSSHPSISYAVFCLKKNKKDKDVVHFDRLHVGCSRCVGYGEVG